MTYRITGIDPAPYRHLFGLSDEELATHGVVRMTVSEKPSFPCRVSLTDRDVGESVLLVNHVSHQVANAYRAAHAIFVTEADEEPAEYVDEVPPVFGPRVLSLRGFDKDGMMADAMLTQPGEADAGIRKLFETRRSRRSTLTTRPAAASRPRSKGTEQWPALRPRLIGLDRHL